MDDHGISLGRGRLTRFYTRPKALTLFTAAAPAAILFQEHTKTMSALLPTYSRSELVFDRGQGAYLFTGSGERYLDFSSGVAVTALGHAHPRLI